MNNTQLPFGTPLGMPVIDGTTVEIFSNGDNHFISDLKSHDRDNNYLGITYQCVEFVRRYIYLHHAVNLALLWQDGDACDWFTKRERMQLAAIPPAEAREGDILTFTGGKWGHVGIVAARAGSEIFMTSQNFLNTADDCHFRLSGAVLAGQVPASDAHGAAFYFQSVLRFLP